MEAAEDRLVAIIDRALSDVAERPVRGEIIDVLLDLRLRVLELEALDWIESEAGLDREHARPRSRLGVGLIKRQA